MSEETRQALENALRAHVHDETGGGFLTDWHVVAASVPPVDNRMTSYSYLASESSRHSLLGLLELARCSFDEDDDD